MIAAAAIAPHAPLLALDSAPAEGVTQVRSGMQRLERALDNAVGTCVVLSPHGPATGIYRRASGSLRGFGVPDERGHGLVDAELVGELASRLGWPILDGDVDHGVHVPITQLHRSPRLVVGACLNEGLGDDAVTDAAVDLARALHAVDRPVAFVASAHTSSALSPRAPLGHRPEAEAAERRFLTALRVGDDVRGAARSLLRDGASCGAAPLVAFAELLPEGTRSEILACEHPFGVGYLVARAL